MEQVEDRRSWRRHSLSGATVENQQHFPATLQPCGLAAWWQSAALLARPEWPLFVVVLEGAVNQQLAPDTGLQLRKEAERRGEYSAGS